MIAWAIALGRGVFGDVPFGVRFVPLLFAAGTAALLARLARRFYGERAALWAVALVSIQPITFLAAGSGFPDSPLLFFWALAMTFAWNALETRRGGWWLAAGAALGAGMLSKYTAAFLVPSVLAYLLVTPAERRWLRTPWPYLAGLVSLVVFAPVVWWNGTHDWVSFRYQSVDRFSQANEINPIAAAKFLGGQWLGVAPLVLPLAAVAAWRAARSSRQEERYLFWLWAPMVGFFFLLGWTRAIHLMWPLAAWLGLTVVMAGALAEGGTRVARFYETRRRWLVGVSAVALLGAGLHAAIFLPGLAPMQGLYGWDVVAARAREIRSQLGDGSFYLAVGRKYVCTSQLAFHLGTPGLVYGKNLLGQEGLQYSYWASPERLAGRDAVVVIQDGDSAAGLLAAVRERFRSVEPAGTLDVPVGRAVVVARLKRVTFSLYRAHGYRAGGATLGVR